MGKPESTLQIYFLNCLNIYNRRYKAYQFNDLQKQLSEHFYVCDSLLVSPIQANIINLIRIFVFLSKLDCYLRALTLFGAKRQLPYPSNNFCTNILDYDRIITMRASMDIG